jgi:hypothetical protein
MDCLPVRQRLTEYALSNLDPHERAFVERHLEWCAGCRKEAAELALAASLVGHATSQSELPAGLEERVVRAVRVASGARPRRRRVRAVGVLVAATLLLGALGVGWGTSVVQNARQKANAARLQAEDLSLRLQNLIKSVSPKSRPVVGPRDHLKEAQLGPTEGREGGGSAAVFISPVREDWVLVVVGGMSPKGAPFHVSVRDKYGRFAYVGTIAKLDAGGGASLWHEFQQLLGGYTDVVVRDRAGHIVLTGSIAPTPVATTTP